MTIRGALLATLPAGCWLAIARLTLRLTRMARRRQVISARRALGWIAHAGWLYRTGFATWRLRGGKWR